MFTAKQRKRILENINNPELPRKRELSLTPKERSRRNSARKEYFIESFGKQNPKYCREFTQLFNAGFMGAKSGLERSVDVEEYKKVQAEHDMFREYYENKHDTMSDKERWHFNGCFLNDACKQSTIGAGFNAFKDSQLNNK
jgi:hypothetical protein